MCAMSTKCLVTKATAFCFAKLRVEARLAEPALYVQAYIWPIYLYMAYIYRGEARGVVERDLCRSLDGLPLGSHS